MEKLSVNEAYEDPEMRAEVEDFLRQHGMMSVSERMVPIIKRLSPEAHERWISNEEILVPIEKELAETPEVKRMKSLQQLGGKTTPDDSSNSSYVKSPAFQTRFDHCELSAAFYKVIGAGAGFSIEKIKNGVAASWLHDIGHSAFGHIGDGLLVQNGWKDHEERSIELLKNSPELAKIFEGNALSIDEVASVIGEEGYAGAVQSIVDTLSYMVLDSGMAKCGYVPDGGFKYLADIAGVDSKRNMLVVKTPELWQELLEIRARMMQEIYYHPVNKLAEEATRQLLRLAIQKKLITFDELAHGTDMPLRLKLQSLIQFDPGAARLSGRVNTDPLLAEYKDIYALTMGFDANDWEHRMFDTEEEAMDFVGRQSPEAIKSSLIVSPFDYTKKKLTLLIARDNKEPEEKTFRATETKLRPEDTKYIVYFQNKR